MGFRPPVSAGSGIPGGGADGQVLTKQSATDGDALWEDLPAAVGSQPALTSTGTTADFGAALANDFASVAREKRYSGTLNANLTVTDSNPVAGSTLVIEGAQDATGGRTLTVDGQAIPIPTDPSAKVSVLVRWYDAATFRWVSAGVETDPELAAHLLDTTDAHDASAISYQGGAGTSASDVEAALDELSLEKLTNPMTAADDLIVGGASGAPTRLAKGSNNTVLGVNGSGVLGFKADPSGGGGNAGTPLRSGKAYLPPIGFPSFGVNNNLAGGTAHAHPFVAGRTCTLASIRGQIQIAATAGTRFRWLICADSAAGGFPGVILTNGMTDLTAIDATGMVTGTFAIPPDLVAGTLYWLVGYQYDAAAANGQWKGGNGHSGNPLMPSDITNPSIGGTLKWGAGGTLIGVASPPSPLGSSGDWAVASEYPAWMLVAS